jgi:hypothetical protein
MEWMVQANLTTDGLPNSELAMLNKRGSHKGGDIGKGLPLKLLTVLRRLRSVCARSSLSLLLVCFDRKMLSVGAIELVPGA